MTQEQKINYMRIAAGICGFAIDNKNLDMLVSLYDLTMLKKGKTDLDSIVDVQQEVLKRNLKTPGIEKKEETK